MLISDHLCSADYPNEMLTIKKGRGFLPLIVIWYVAKLSLTKFPSYGIIN